RARALALDRTGARSAADPAAAGGQRAPAPAQGCARRAPAAAQPQRRGARRGAHRRVHARWWPLRRGRLRRSRRERRTSPGGDAGRGVHLPDRDRRPRAHERRRRRAAQSVRADLTMRRPQPRPITPKPPRLRQLWAERGFSAADLLNLWTPAAPGARQESIRYGDAPRQMLDVYRPRHATHAPMVVFFYGGSWQTGTRDLYAFLGNALAAQGIVAVVPDYTVFPEARFP